MKYELGIGDLLFRFGKKEQGCEDERISGTLVCGHRRLRRCPNKPDPNGLDCPGMKNRRRYSTLLSSQNFEFPLAGLCFLLIRLFLSCRRMDGCDGVVSGPFGILLLVHFYTRGAAVNHSMAFVSGVSETTHGWEWEGLDIILVHAGSRCLVFSLSVRWTLGVNYDYCSLPRSEMLWSLFFLVLEIECLALRFGTGCC